MKPIYYVLNYDKVIAAVYQNDNNKTIFVKDPNIDIEYGLIFRNKMGKVIEDLEVMNIFKEFLHI
jgi:hypothetical protein